MSESGFFTVETMKAKFKNKLNCEADLKCALQYLLQKLKLNFWFVKLATFFPLMKVNCCSVQCFQILQQGEVRFLMASSKKFAPEGLKTPGLTHIERV